MGLVTRLYNAPRGDPVRARVIVRSNQSEVHAGITDEGIFDAARGGTAKVNKPPPVGSAGRFR